jgi:hypothetical protein
MEEKSQNMELAKENHEINKEHREIAMQAQAEAGQADPGNKPGEPAQSNPDTEREQDAGEGLRTSEKQPNKTNPNKATNIAAKALQSTLKGLHDYEMRVVSQKQKSRPDRLSEAMNEWYPKFRETLESTLNDWAEVLPEFGLDAKDLVDTWLTASSENMGAQDVPAALTESYNKMIGEINDSE